jgi:transposase
MNKEIRVIASEFLEKLARADLVVCKAFELSHRPRHERQIDVTQQWVQRRGSESPVVIEPSRPGRRASTPSAQRAYAWLVGWDERGNQVPKRAEHRQFVEALCAIEPQIAQASSLPREFLGLIHRRDVAGFGWWLARARDGKAPEIRRFADSMTADLSAVRAAFESPWSSGQVEGQINRLKFLRRQMSISSIHGDNWLRDCSPELVEPVST